MVMNPGEIFRIYTKIFTTNKPFEPINQLVIQIVITYLNRFILNQPFDQSISVISDLREIPIT